MSVELFSLKGKRALVTGGTHGLGMAIAKALAAAGAEIVINDISQDKLQAAKEQYSSEGIVVTSLQFNVTDEEQVKDSLAKIEKENGPIDILVNNAGIIKRIPIWGTWSMINDE